MPIKYNFTTTFAEANPLYGAMIEVNNATNHLLIYCILAIIFIISSYVMIRKTQDIGKSLLSSMHILMIVSLILFYAGKMMGDVLVPEVLMLSIIMIEILGIAGLYFNRMKGA